MRTETLFSGHELTRQLGESALTAITWRVSRLVFLAWFCSIFILFAAGVLKSQGKSGHNPQHFAEQLQHCRRSLIVSEKVSQSERSSRSLFKLVECSGSLRKSYQKVV